LSADPEVVEAAAYLHDVGHYIADSSHHKHSYYVVANSDISGFTARERQLIANLCRYHRKALPSPDHENLRPLAAEDKEALGRLIPLLRLADGLDQGHSQRVERIVCALRDGEFALELHASGDIGLERWAAEQVAGLFEQVYRRKLVVRSQRPAAGGEA
jgi:exopolyphosphatase/guanosine-5'-triphosphate,3'-diphosphate pyrophosphatase